MNRLPPRDAALPHLARALDGDAMAPLFADRLGGVPVQACEIERVKYRPQRNCSVVYRLRLRDRQDGRAFEQRVSARWCHGGDAGLRFARSASQPAVASAAGPSVSHWPVLDMLAHWWPNDAKLGALRLLADDAEWRRRWLPEVVAALSGGRGGLVDHRTTVVQMVPELRLCARVDLRWRREPGAAACEQTLYAKADLERDGAATHAVMRALGAGAAQVRGRLRTAPALLWQEGTGLHWQLGLPGRPLHDVDPSIGAGVSARVGEQLAALHAVPVPAPRTATIDTLRARLRQAVELLGRVEPAWLPQLTRIASGLDAGAAALAREPFATLHGDLHPANILCDGAQLAFIDLDSVHAGPAVLELGGWVGDMPYRAVLDGIAPSRVAPAGQAFLAAYAAASRRAVDAGLLAWSTAHHLLCRRACGSVANLKPGRFEAVPRLLALAEAIAGAGHVDAAFEAQREAA